jgi:hypothetical protein
MTPATERASRKMAMFKKKELGPPHPVHLLIKENAVKPIYAPQVKRAPWAKFRTLRKPKINENPEDTKKRSMPMATPDTVRVM